MNVEERSLESYTSVPTASQVSPQGEVDPLLSEVQKNWNEFGKRDPLWAILTEESKRDNKWDLVEFFATGEREIAGVIKDIEKLNHALARGKALDFGCGVGRLTQALCRHFEECHGLDIAESMVEKAREYNRYGARCHYHVNTKPDLSLFADNTFDFIYTNIVLQHNPPAMSRRFIREFLRILTPGGLLVFQLPSEPLQSLAGEGSPMKQTAFRAQLTMVDTDMRLVAGTAKRFSITVKNMSPETWPGKAVSGKLGVRLGNHWRDAKNRIIINDDARADLPHDLKPGEEITLSLDVSVPGVPGQYRLEFDMVQEMVAWFADKKSPTLMLDVEVLPNQQNQTPAKPDAVGELDNWFAGKPPSKTGSEPAKSAVLVPRMEMNGIPKAEVLEFLKAHGGHVLSAIDDPCATGWVGYRYHVTKGVKSSQPEVSEYNSANQQNLNPVNGNAEPFKRGFRPHQIEWDEEKVGRFWDHMSASVVGKEEYFSRQVGQGVTNFLAASCPEALAGKVLDFGCGPGYLLEPMSKMSGEIWGADSSLDSLKAATDKMRGKSNWRGGLVAENGKVGQPDGRFDLITCVETIEHVIPQHLEPMLKELHRLLRRYHGLLLITTPFDERLEMSEVFCPDCGASFHRWQHVRKFTVDTLSSLVERNGFSTQLCTNLNFCDFQTHEFPAAGMPVSRVQVTSRLGRGPHLIWLGRAI